MTRANDPQPADAGTTVGAVDRESTGDEKMTTTINQNVTSGKWAVAIVGYKGWRRDAAIGDGITSALNALITRCETKAEAEELAAALNAEQPSILPGSPDVPVYEARRYAKSDYIGRQAREQNGNRDCDRRIVHI